MKCLTVNRERSEGDGFLQTRLFIEKTHFTDISRQTKKGPGSSPRPDMRMGGVARRALNVPVCGGVNETTFGVAENQINILHKISASGFGFMNSIGRGLRGLRDSLAMGKKC